MVVVSTILIPTSIISSGSLIKVKVESGSGRPVYLGSEIYAVCGFLTEETSSFFSLFIAI